MTETMRLSPGALSFEQLRSLATSAHKVVLDESCWPAVEAAAAVVERAARSGAPVYGINTGFGKLATVRIAADQIEELQRRLVLSHMCGLGPALPDPVVRLVLVLKAASLALGYSGVRRRTIELLLALIGLFRALAVFDAALIAGAMSVDAALGSDVPFDPRLNAVRGQIAQIRVAERLHALLAGSAIRASHLVECERVQDPYSLRCQPQVMGACLELLDGAAAVLEREANGVSDNPLVFAEDGAILSGGNFHGEPVALAADQIALALAEIGSLAARRTPLPTAPH